MQKFKVGDHVIVDEGDYLDNGLDGVVEWVSGYVTTIRGWSSILNRPALRNYNYPPALIKVDNLVTYPEFKRGDRALVVSNTPYDDGGITHFIEVGTDVEIIEGPHTRVGGGPYYDVYGVHKSSDVCVWQSVAACDLEPEPTHSRRSWWVDYAPADYKAERAIDYTLTPAATVALDDNLVRRYLALHGATELLGASRDVDELTAVADWLLAS